jgi:FAD/FMN-containing dehydrogenase
MNAFFTIFFILISFSANCLANANIIKCTDNVLKQIYPNQNACVLQKSIPPKLQRLPFVIYPIEVSDYNIARFNFNKRFNVFPKAIIATKSSFTLSKILSYLNEKQLNFSIRSGGHCFEPGSLSQDYILDLSRFDSIKISKNEVYIGAGARLGPVIEKLGKYDLVIPTGTCQSVGIGGLTIGGGIGFLSRTFGLTCDVLKSITFLTANSDIIEVNKNHHSDLFWALCGAGNGSYGIALGFTFKTFYVPKASFLKLTWKWDPLLVHQIFDAWHVWIQQLPDNINPVLTLEYVDGNLSIILEALKVGKEPFSEWEQAFQKLNPVVQLQKGRYANLAQLWADSPTTPFQKIKSLIAFQPVSYAVVQLTVQYFEQLRLNKALFNVGFEFSAFGGKLAQGDTAFFPRQAVEWWHQSVNWNQQEQEAAALASIRQFYDSVAPLVSKFSYANDVDYDLGSQYLEAYYGDHVNRLIQIKNIYDPQNIFHWKQSIPL